MFTKNIQLNVVPHFGNALKESSESISKAIEPIKDLKMPTNFSFGDKHLNLDHTNLESFIDYESLDKTLAEIKNVEFEKLKNSLSENGVVDVIKLQEQWAAKEKELFGNAKNSLDALKHYQDATKKDGWQTKALNAVNKIKKGFGEMSSIVGKMSSAMGISISDFTGLFTNAIGDAVNTLKEATKFNSQGRYTSLETQEKKAELGAESDADYYAIIKAKEQLGMSDDEYFMGGVNDERAKALQELIAIEKANYEQMKNSGALEAMEQAQKDWQDFQNKFKSTVIAFISEHGKTIVESLSGLLNVVGAIFSVISSILNVMSSELKTDEQVASETDKIINSYTFKTNNININNNMSSVNPGITSKTQLEKASVENGQVIARAIGF